MTDHAILTAEAHRTLRVRPERGADYGDAVMCCVTVPDEFRRVQAEYPILFRLNADRDGYAAFAMFGFDNDENLFLDGDRWDAHYVPLAIDIQPFLIGRAADGGDEGGQVHVDLASPRIGAEGTPVFDEHGRATPFLERIAERLGSLDAGYRGSAGFFEALRRHELLEPLTLEVTLADNSTNRLVGFHVIDEDRLQALDPETVAELHEAGHLMPIFMAIASLAQFSELVARKNRRLGDG
jgi:hypothetical protein